MHCCLALLICECTAHTHTHTRNQAQTYNKYSTRGLPKINKQTEAKAQTRITPTTTTTIPDSSSSSSSRSNEGIIYRWETSSGYNSISAMKIGIIYHLRLSYVCAVVAVAVLTCISSFCFFSELKGGRRAINYATMMATDVCGNVCSVRVCVCVCASFALLYFITLISLCSAHRMCVCRFVGVVCVAVI